MSGNPEHLSSGESELIMLRADLQELFQKHAEIVAFQQPDDLTLPTEMMIAGMFHSTDDDGPFSMEVHVRHRIGIYGSDYLVITGEPGEFNWIQVTEKFASIIYQGGENPLDTDDIFAIRQLLGSNDTRWNDTDTKRWAQIESLYAMADTYANRG